MVPPAVAVLAAVATWLTIIAIGCADENSSWVGDFVAPNPYQNFCEQLVVPNGYDCAEHTIQTEDGYILALQRVASRYNHIRDASSHPILLQHGLFMGGDAWFLNVASQSLGFILADHGFDVWVGNVRGTRWSKGHISLSVRDKEFWDWSWEELALYDLAEMLRYINLVAGTKVFLVGHSQGTIMSLAALSYSHISSMVEAAALLCPISHLGHVSAPLVLRMVGMHLDQIVVAMGIHQLNFRSDVGVRLLDMICDGHIECDDLLTSLTGKNCCFNNSRVDFYLDYEPHPSSSKNLRHLFQMIRKGTFSKYDYGYLKNMKVYGKPKPPAFDLSLIPDSIPLWMAYGGQDSLADLTDFKLTLDELSSEPELLYLENYGHVDFIAGTDAKEDVYNRMIEFFASSRRSASA
ncbi:hypothetical protein MLD38_023315 [Melastoma candidum]|uniref:Uncharacterized protein n=1 Tax=Melastoma candidum TaxID=119954 RepID=A0ACB9QR25_9MYRT|nr:hypothetical protein MLD38_023315 [Melastoma candidum]